MKKKVIMLSCIAAVAIATFVGQKTYKSNAYEMNDLLVQNVEALSNEETPKAYKRATGDCEIVASAGATVSLKLLGVTIASAKAGADGRVVFKDVLVTCEIDGTFLCNPKECGDFYVDIIKAAKDDEDENEKDN